MVKVLTPNTFLILTTESNVRNPFPSRKITFSGMPWAINESFIHSGSFIPSRLFSSPLIRIYFIFPALYNYSVALMRYWKNIFLRPPIRVWGAVPSNKPTSAGLLESILLNTLSLVDILTIWLQVIDTPTNKSKMHPTKTKERRIKSLNLITAYYYYCDSQH